MPKTAKNKFFRDPQNIIALGVTVISLCALIVSLIQTSLLKEERELMREYSRASVWPHIEVSIGKEFNTDDGSIKNFSFSITNSGVGPAIVTDVKMSCNDTTAKNWWDLFEILEIPDSIDTHIRNGSFNGRVIKIGETFEALSLEDNLPLANAFYERIQEKKMSIEIYYESIYGEKWEYHNGKTIKLEKFEGLPKEEQFW